MNPTTSPAKRNTFNVLINAGVGCFFTYGVALMMDHLYMVNGSEYPKALSTPVTVLSNGDAGIEGFSDLCNNRGGWDFYNKENGHFMRCTTILTGAFSWPKTYLIENYDQLANER